jgi:multidrug resistance efflux pump
VARTAAVGGAAHHAGKKQQAAADEAVAEQAAQEQASAPESTDVTVELQRLADLKASGAITEEEFAAAKAKLLGT